MPEPSAGGAGASRGRWRWRAARAARSALRLWGIKHGLPFVYNVDEASNFVPTAVSYFFTDSYNPHYFINPPAFSYLLHVVFALWFGGGDDGRHTRSRPTRPRCSWSRASPRRCSARPRSASST